MKKVKDYCQIHGKDEKSPKRNLYQLLGDDGCSKYQTMDLEKYTARLQSMGRADLYEEAIKRGLFPNDNLTLLKERLLNEFKIHVNQYKPLMEVPKPPKMSKKGLAILAEGR